MTKAKRWAKKSLYAVESHGLNVRATVSSMERLPDVYVLCVTSMDDGERLDWSIFYDLEAAITTADRAVKGWID